MTRNGSPESMLSGIIDLKVVLTDGDGDTATDTIDLGSLIKFEDDGPAIDIPVATGATLAAGRVARHYGLGAERGRCGQQRRDQCGRGGGRHRLRDAGGVVPVYDAGVGCRGGRPEFSRSLRWW